MNNFVPFYFTQSLYMYNDATPLITYPAKKTVPSVYTCKFPIVLCKIHKFITISLKYIVF
jgi:hypothetical protein